MKNNKHKNMAMIVVSAAILAAANLGVWQAANQGAIAPIGNIGLWLSFVALNIVSLVWAFSLLGLQPLVVVVSYLAGGFLAFKGVQGMDSINVAEVTTAGATYGAFGALAIGNATVKVRLAFFRKGQVPFIFIIVALLVFDAALNSGISSADGSVILNAVVFPFVLAGVVVGLIWSVLNRYGIGQKEETAQASLEVEQPVAVEKAVVAEGSNALKIGIPMHAMAKDESEHEAVAAVAEENEPPVAQEVLAKKSVVPVVAEEEKEEEFFPLEIDKHDEVIPPKAETVAVPMPEMSAELDAEDPFNLSSFDVSLYASGADEDGHGSAMVEEPAVAVDLDREVEALPAVAAKAEKPVSKPAMAIVEEAADPEPETAKVTPMPKAEPRKNVGSNDWLSGHLDLLSKIK